MTFNLALFEDHLEELRRRLIVCFTTVVVAFLACYALSGQIISILFYPVRQALPPGSTLVFTALPEGFMAYLKVAFWSSLTLSSPVLLYHTWAFVAPGLYSHEKAMGRRLILWGSGLFIAGALFGYWVVMPVVLSITLGYVSQGLQALPRLQNYLVFILKTLLTFGLLFELPFVMAMAGRSGIVPKDFFKRHRRYALIALFILAVFLAPTDMFSQLLLFLPLALVYETGSRLAGWLAPAKEARKQ